MTTGIASAKVNGMLDAIRTGGSSLTAITNAFVKLHTGDPGAAGTANAAAGSTTRPGISHGAVSGGSMSISGTNPSWTNGGTSETITHISVWDSATAGNFLYSIALTASKAWASGDTLTLTSCTLSIAPVAA
jgi:hypothetical protein